MFPRNIAKVKPEKFPGWRKSFIKKNWRDIFNHNIYNSNFASVEHNTDTNKIAENSPINPNPSK